MSNEADRKRDLRRLKSLRQESVRTEGLYQSLRDFCIKAYGEAAVTDADPDREKERKRRSGRPAGSKAKDDIAAIVQSLSGPRFISPDVERACGTNGTPYHAGTISKVLGQLQENGVLRKHQTKRNGRRAIEWEKVQMM